MTRLVRNCSCDNDVVWWYLELSNTHKDAHEMLMPCVYRPNFGPNYLNLPPSRSRRRAISPLMWQLHPLRSITPFSPVAIHTFLHAPLFLHREYLSKIDLEVLEHAEAYLSGQKKQELSDWWLHYIEESVDTYLHQHGYDPSCVPFEYLDKPPSSMARLQDNIRIVHRLLGDLGHKRHPHTTKTQAELINPVKKSVYEKVDTLSTHLKLVLWDQINGYGCRMDFNHIYSLRSAAFLEEAYQHLDTIRGIISREDSAGISQTSFSSPNTPAYTL